jgi:hypothetical protein
MTTEVVILAHATDRGAEAVGRWLSGRTGSPPVRIVRPETLGLAKWSHRVDSGGRAATRVEWSNTQPLEDSSVGAVLNRIRYLPVARFRRASAKDRDYAGAELEAVVASWLAGLGERVVHVVRRHPWVTPVLPLQHWAAAAAGFRLPVAPGVIMSSARALRWQARRDQGPAPAGDVPAGTVLVAGREVGGTLAGRYGPRCLDTARRLGFPLLEFGFATRAGELVLIDVNPLPSLAEPWATELAGRLLQCIAAEAA